jgi:hypothetical protein
MPMIATVIKYAVIPSGYFGWGRHPFECLLVEVKSI